MNSKKGNETKSVFIGCEILKYFNDFYNWYLSISLQK